MSGNYLHWEDQIVLLSEIDSFASEDIEITTEAFKYLQVVIGPIHSGQRHPLILLILNQVAHSRDILVELANELRGFESDSKFSDLVRKLKDRKKCEEAISLLETSRVFGQSGFNLVLEPFVDGSHPDFGIVDALSNILFFVEVSIVNDNEKYLAHQKLFYKTAMKYPNLDSSYLLLKNLSPNEQDDLESELQTFLSKTQENQELAVFEKPGIIHFGAAPVSEREKLISWCEPFGLRPGCYLDPPENHQPFKYILRKFKKRSQLPAGYPNVLWLKLKGYHVPMFNPVLLGMMLKEELDARPNIYALVISDRTLLSTIESGVYQIDENLYYLCIKKRNGRVEHRLVIFNKGHEANDDIRKALMFM